MPISLPSPPKNKPSFEFNFPVKEGPGGSIKPQTSQPLITSMNADYSIGLIYFRQRFKKSTNSEIPQVENVASRMPSNRREAFQKCLPDTGWPGELRTRCWGFFSEDGDAASCADSFSVKFISQTTSGSSCIIFPRDLDLASCARLSAAYINGGEIK